MKPDKHYFMTGLILQKIYDSEIHLSIGWMWDGGLDYKIGEDLSYLNSKPVSSTGIDDIGDAVVILANKVSLEYPDSMFTSWWNDIKDS